MERRTYQHQLEVREATEGTNSIGTLGGYIAVFNEDSVDMGGWIEQVSPGAFAESLASHDVVCLHNHDTNVVYGRLSAGTLRLWEDDKGLAFEVDLPDTTDARNLKALCERGDQRGCSFGFEIDQEHHEGPDHVKLDKVTLYEVSIGVTFPAYESTVCETRTRRLEQQKARERQYRRNQALALLKIQH